MKIRKTRDGSYWMDDQRVLPVDVAAFVDLSPVSATHFSYDSASGLLACFSVRDTGEVDQVADAVAAQVALALIDHANDIIAARDKRVADAYAAANPPLTAEQQAARELAASDVGMARITEDVIDLLIAKGLIQLSDLPAAAVAKITDRKALRAAAKA